MSQIARGILRAFDAPSSTATLEVIGSPDAYLTAVPVNRGLAVAELVAGRIVLLILFDEHNPADAMVTGVF